MSNSSNPAEITKQEVERARYARYLDLDEVIYSLCWEDVLGVIVEHLCEHGLAPENLGGAELQALLDKAKDYVEGDGMPGLDIRKPAQWSQRKAEVKTVLQNLCKSVDNR